jgi:hypothetical protein
MLFNLSELDVILVFNSGEMTKAAVESGAGVTGISEVNGNKKNYS